MLAVELLGINLTLEWETFSISEKTLQKTPISRITHLNRYEIGSIQSANCEKVLSTKVKSAEKEESPRLYYTIKFPLNTDNSPDTRLRALLAN